ncbi:MAG TPA: efflux RND transporter permease subunit, partial [Candidatus Aquilonibacter sp.]|nr:efflux RND transporter permease subunit [Candidatus Aquilonibacter sp.]
MWLTRFAIARWVITLMVFVALLVFGLISFLQLGRSSNPPGTDFPVVVVYAGYPGASPQDMERMVIKPIEDQMQGIENLDELDATAQEGSAAVVAIFKMGTNLDLAAVDVQRRVDTARVYMPADLNPPSVTKQGQSEPPLLDLAVSSKSLSQIQIADMVNNQVVPLIEAVPNVQSVDVYGTADREFHVLPDPNRLVGTNATLSDVFNAVATNNLNVPGGIMMQPTQEGTVAIHSYIDNANDILGIPLPVPGSTDKNLHVGDVATATDSHVEMRTISHYNGKPRVYMQINPVLTADQIKSTATLRAALKDIEGKFPQLKFSEIDAPADYTSKQLVGVGQSLIEGIILTAIVMLLFLHAWRNAVVVFLAIPTSIFATFILMRLFGFHIDSLSMMGLSLIIGILVDDSIVVLENITRHRDMGEDATNAAINGRSEIGAAAIAITMVDVIVFLPIAFLPGIVGAYLKEFAAVVVIATLFSLLVSFTLTPLLAARWSVVKRSEAKPKWLMALDNRVLDAVLFTVAVALFAIGTVSGWFLLNVVGVMIVALLFLNAFVHRYERILDFYRGKLLPFALTHGAFVVFVCLVLFLNAVTLVSGGGMNTVMFDVVIFAVTAIVHGVAFALRRFRKRPWEYRGSNVFAELWFNNLNLLRSIGTKRGTLIATPLVIVASALVFGFAGGISTDFVPQQQDGSINMSVTYPPGTPIATTNDYVVRLEDAIMKLPHLKSVSSTVGRKQSGHSGVTGGNYATLHAQMDDGHIKDTNTTIARIRKLAYLVPGADFQVAGEGGGGNGSGIFYALTGPDDEIGPAAEKVAQFLRTIPGTVNVQTSSEGGAPRLNVDIDRGRCTLLGVNPSAAATVARIAVDGAVATRVRT